MSTTEVWQNNTLIMTIDLENVTVELLLANSNGLQRPAKSLAKLDFKCSTYTFDSFSDHVKDTRLVCQAIVMSDTRFRGENNNNI